MEKLVEGTVFIVEVRFNDGNVGRYRTHIPAFGGEGHVRASIQSQFRLRGACSHSIIGRMSKPVEAHVGSFKLLRECHSSFEEMLAEGIKFNSYIMSRESLEEPKL